MKNSFPRFVFVALLSTAAGMVFAGENWKAPIPGGANTINLKSTVTKEARVIERGPIYDKSGNIIGVVGHDGSVYDGKKTIGRVDWNGNLVSNQQLINEKVLETVEEYRSDAGACHLVKEGVEGVEESIGVYADNSSNFSLDERIVGDNSSVPFAQPSDKGDTKLVALIHNHPGESQNPWPSVADVRSAIRKGKDVYVVDCSNGGAVLRINHETGVVTKLTSNGDELPVAWNEFANDAGDPIYRSHFLKQKEVKTASDLSGRDLYDPSRFSEIKRAIRISKNEGGASVRDVKMPDLTKLINLFKQSVEYLRRMNAMSNKPGEEYYAGYNKLVAKARAEIKVIENEIAQMNLTEAEKVELGNELGKQIREKVVPYCDMITSLRRQLEAKGYGRFEDSNFNFDPKYLK